VLMLGIGEANLSLRQKEVEMNPFGKILLGLGVAGGTLGLGVLPIDLVDAGLPLMR
jgi:hypothetical protein